MQSIYSKIQYLTEFTMVSSYEDTLSSSDDLWMLIKILNINKFKRVFLFILQDTITQAVNCKCKVYYT